MISRNGFFLSRYSEVIEPRPGNSMLPPLVSFYNFLCFIGQQTFRLLQCSLIFFVWLKKLDHNIRFSLLFTNVMFQTSVHIQNYKINKKIFLESLFSKCNWLLKTGVVSFKEPLSFLQKYFFCFCSCLSFKHYCCIIWFCFHTFNAIIISLSFSHSFLIMWWWCMHIWQVYSRANSR